ncbi:ABC transporter permease [Candidatus Gracilibacteria bacterium]|nr:ABC transporter permease [Candidatus Gracilibacteria bacterium]
MIFSDLLEEAFSALTVNKVRSGLTILGIVIGIGSVIAMVAIGQGAQDSIQDSIKSIGSNLIMVRPGFQRGSGGVRSGRGSAQTLTQKDADSIAKEIPLAQSVAPEISRSYQVTAKSKNTNTRTIGTVALYSKIRNIEMETGSFISDQNVRSLSRVAVIGPTTALDLFGEGSNPIGNKIRINRIDFTIIGVTKAKGESGFGSSDDIIYLPISTAQRFLANDDYVSMISIQTENQEEMTMLQEQITELLLRRHNIGDPTLADFSVVNQADIVETASSIAKTFTILLASIAGISLIVGGIGIMNMMLTTVTERTREIGLRKAIGAQKRDISTQFLMESVILTFFGGLIGIILGAGISFAVEKLANISTNISLSSVFLAFCVSAVIGIVFGYYPAKRAAGFNPIEALRYE